MRTKIIRGLSAFVKVIGGASAVTAYFNPELLPAKYVVPALILVALISGLKDAALWLCDVLDDGKVNGSYKLPVIALLLCSCMMLASCALDPAQKAQLQMNLLKDGEAAAVGFATGGRAGAVAGVAAQVVKNHAPAVTAAKQPVDVTPKR